ncbi:MAG: hypothetical protein AB1726_00310 [Planctomycetota bacterium]
MDDERPAPSPRFPLLGLSTLLPLALVAVASAAAFSLHTSRARFDRGREEVRDELQASCASEAGLGAAALDLRMGGDGNLGEAEEPIRIGEGFYWVQTTRLESGLLSVRSTGGAGSFRRRTELVARPAGTPTAPLETISRRIVPLAPADE